MITGGRDFELPDPTDPNDPGISSTPIILVANDEPTNDGDVTPDPDSDLSVDFGVTQPFSIGNQIWFDTNNDGVNDLAEEGVDGVLVELYEPDGSGGFTQVGTTQTTAGGGYYLFDKLPPGDYTVVLPASNFTTGGPLEGYYSSGTSILADGTNSESPAQDPDNDLDNDDNGTLTLAGPFPGAVVSAPVTLGVNPFEPTSDNDTTPPGIIDPAPDFLTNYTVDFGFYTTSLGNLVWEDQNNNGVRDQGEPTIQGVTVELLSADGLTVLATDVTNANGRYLFDDLPEGDYQIRLTPPAGFVSSTGTNGQPAGPYEPAVDPNTVNVNNDDNGTNGTGVNQGFVLSPIISQVPGGEHDVDLATGSSEDRRVDFGLFEPLNIGNRVFLDDDGITTPLSTSNNGEQDSGEPGIAGVDLSLYLDSNGDGQPDNLGSPIAQTTTDGNGYYMFDYLIEGTYVVGIDASNFAAGGALDTLISSTISDPTPNNNQDLDDNGIDDPDYEANGIFSGPITLVDDDEPTNEGDKGPQGDGLADNDNSNLTVDFGFVAPATYGNFVWEDLNEDGVQDPGEPGVENVIVTLYEYDQTTFTTIGVVARDTTDANGSYLFEGLPPNRYYYADYTNIPAGYVVSPINSVVNDTIDSDINPITFRNVQTHLAPAERDTTWDAGIYLPLSGLGDFVWEDLDEDGFFDQGEPPVQGVKVILYEATGAKVDSAFTDATGLYRFEDLQPGDYFVEFAEFPAGYEDYVFSPGNQGPNDLADSDADPNTGRTPIISLAPGEFDPTWDAGIYLPKASLGDRVWFDADEDGVQDPNELGAQGVKVILYDGNGNKVDSTTTDFLGNYSFDDLTPGDYSVEFKDLPPTYVFTDQGQGGDGTKDSDVDPNTGFTATVTLGAGENNPDIDAGLVQGRASLGDRVWEDLNQDGIQDPNEPGVAGVRVILFNANNQPIGFTTTDQQGNYSFDNLIPGDYRVGFSNLPAGYQLTQQDAGNDDTKDSDVDPTTGLTILTNLVAGENDPTWDAGIFQPKASLGDRVWEDLNQDGRQDAGEPGVAGVKVILLDGNGVKIDSTTTNSAGEYLFDQLDPGTYSVQFKDLPTGYTLSPQDVGTNEGIDSDADVNTGLTDPVVLSAGQDYRDLDAGIFLPKASIGNRVWNDTNNNGVQDPGEVGVPGVRVNLYKSDGTFVGQTSTDLSGQYGFTQLEPGDYYIEIPVLPVDYVFSPQDNGPDDATDSDADPITGRMATTTLDPGENDPDWDAGISIPTARLGDRVWYDTDEDGEQDPGENGVSGVKVVLFDGNGNRLDSTLTDSQGNYLFEDLLPGDYQVGFELPTGYVYSPADQTNDLADSDADPITGLSPIVNLNGGDNNLSVDAGIYEPKASLGDKVWEDLDIDGQQGPNEPGVENVKVVLYDGSGNPLDSTLTNAQGEYLFSDLIPGDYYVEFKDLPNGYGFTGKDTGSDVTDSDADLQGITDIVSLAPGENNLTVDAGIVAPTASLGDYVWYDIDEDGVQEANEPPAEGVKVILYNANGDSLDERITDANGFYLFDNLPGGDYYLEFTDIPPGYELTDQGGGVDPGKDSDADPATSQTPIISLAPGEANLDGGDAGLTIDRLCVCDATEFMPNGFSMIFTSGNYPGSKEYVFDANGGKFITYADGTARLTGQLVNKQNSNLGFELDARFINRKDWTQWSALGRQAKGSQNGPFQTWEFYEIDSLQSKMIGTGGLAGEILTLSHMPVNRIHGPQVGNGANDRNSNYGMSGWWFFTSASGTYSGTGDFNVNLNNCNCSNTPVTTAKLGNRVWYDVNEDGMQDPGEAGVSGVSVTLYSCAGTQIATTTTDAQGIYDFSSLQPGSYYVEFALPAGYLFSPQDVGTEAWDSDADLNGQTACVQLAAGENNYKVDAGMYSPKATLGDKVFEDLNQDGEQDANENGVANVRVVLYTCTGDSVSQTFTDTNGEYLFTQLIPGDYYVIFKDLPAHSGFSPQDVGNDATDSDANQNGQTACVTLGPGADDRTLDAGIIISGPPASLSNRVWDDINEDGLQDASEPGIPNVKVVLYTCLNDSVDEQLTDANGEYEFTNLPAGDYYVVIEDIPAGYDFSPQDQGSDDSIDSDVDANGQTACITLNAGDDITSVDAGLSPDRLRVCEAEEYGPSGFAMIFTNGMYPGGSREYVFDSNGGEFITYANGTARLTGTVVSKTNNASRFRIDARFINRKDWGQWSALGRQAKGANLGPFQTWDFYEIDSLQSRLIGEGNVAGDTFHLSHMPVSRMFGPQVGDGANDRNGNYGMSGWWFFTSTSGTYAGGGDFNVTLENCATIQPPVAPKMGVVAVLEGPYEPSTGVMRTDLNSQGLLPLQQPFSQAPWNYSGTEAVSAIPSAEVVDWVLVEVRDVANPATILSRQAAFMLEDGQVVGLDGHSLLDAPQGQSSFRLVIHNWNHLPVMSAGAVTKYGNVFHHDFSQGLSGLYQDVNVANPAAAVGAGGISLLIEGDATGDQQINSLDLGTIMQQYFNLGREASDTNLDGVINSLDVGRTMRNYFKQSHVPK
jgi:uncharacterized surface anchored protein